MSGLAAEIRRTLEQHRRLLTKQDVESAVGVLREFLKPSERADGPGDFDPEWFYLEYRRAKSVEHSLLRERAARRKLAKQHTAEELAGEVVNLKGVIGRLVGAIRAWAGRERMPDFVEGSFVEAVRVSGGTHAGRDEMEAVLRQMMAEASGRACEVLAEQFARGKSTPLWDSLPPAAKEAILRWRKLHLQCISANQHRAEAV